jgi:pantetheine-phosphate adenylyltransferase
MKKGPMSIGDAAMYLNSILRESNHGYEDCLDLLKSNYGQPHRHYHNWEHISKLFSIYEKMGSKMTEALFLSTIFHDIIWTPKATNNEKSNELLSAECFMDYVGDKLSKNLVDEVVGAILDTHHTEDSKTTTGAVLCDADLYELIHGDFNTLLKNEMLISKEYQMFHEKDYVAGRLRFLSKWVDRNPHIKDLNEYLKVRKLNVGIYPGTFDPFHVGHLNILLKAERIFDKVIIAFGRNPSKDKLAEETIPEPEKFGFRRVISIDESLAKTIANEGMPTLIRGVRNSQDLNHEMTQNKFVQEMLQSTREENELKVVFIPCDEKYRLISSTALNSLKRVDEGMYKRYLAFC